MILYLTPLIGINEFTFKSDIRNYNNFDFHYTPMNVIGYDTYDIDNSGLSIYAGNNLIESIACTKDLLYKGRNMIGMSIDEFKSHYNLNPSGDIDTLFVDDDETQDVYEFDEVGLQIWCRNNVIVTAIASLV